MTIQRIRIDEINFGDRKRKDYGDLNALATSIRECGLLNPITVAKINGGFQLLAGGRRVKASRDILGQSMIEANVVKFEKDLERLIVERDENSLHKAWTASEKVAIGKAVEEALSERRGRPKTSANADNLQGQKTEDVAAESAGFNSAETYHRATQVVEGGTPELVAAMDAGDVSISDAAAVAGESPDVQNQAVAAVRSGRSRTARGATGKRKKRKKKAKGVQTSHTPDGKCPTCGRRVIPKAERSALFSAVAKVTGADMKAAASHIGKVVTELLSADYTPEEVAALPAAIKKRGMNFTLTLGCLPKYIGWVRADAALATVKLTTKEAAELNRLERQKAGIE